MKTIPALIAIAVALQCTGGCGHTQTAAPRTVRFVTEREMVNGCTHLGRVSGSSVVGGISGRRLGQLRAEREMRDEAERLGADVVLVQSSHGGFWGADAKGDAYQCQGRLKDTPTAPPPSVPASPQGGCEKDTDCKGDRVCESGKCVNP